MTEKEFYDRTKKKPSIDAQSALDILGEHFLGNKNIKSCLSNDERNWLVVNLILKKYKFVNIKRYIKELTEYRRFDEWVLIILAGSIMLIVVGALIYGIYTAYYMIGGNL